MAGNSQNNTPPPVTEEITSNHPLFLHQTDHPGLIFISKKLTGFWDEYDALEAPYMCICAYNCNNGRINGEKNQRKRLIQFLMGLNKGYSNIKGQILLMQPLPSAAKAYTMSRPSTSNSQKYNPPRPSTSSNNSDRRNITVPNTSYERRSTFRKGVYCRNCRKEGHYQEECYKIVGYLVGHPLHGKYQPAKATRPTQDNMTSRTINMTVGHDNWYRIFTKGQKLSQNGQNQAREWKERKNSKPKTCAS
ncbi:cysteine-rich receptor-like protein kinase 8 [Tanacetum coccineum]|uniref:Cysteine-rich receptor-like protein kinase 8 n=1 Tax=Tanacetum coccineum TaxID=301880 RepID=A0ABQ5GV63_9ASTR